jgi:uncharacterized paraquat-inducible protein A
MNKFRQWLRHFMAGRYGTDKLNIALLLTALALCIIPTALALFGLRLLVLDLVATLVSYLLTGIAIFRCFSRNTYRRYEENRKFLRFWERLRDRQNRYYDCPRCHQTVRVPRGKGKISITCPKCKEKFVRKT